MERSENATEKNLRSILVENIPRSITEEDMKDLLTASGSIINFRLFNNESGNSAHAMLCEYADQETALRAIHNLSNYDLKGHTLRIDIAASERCQAVLERLQTSSTETAEENEGNQEKVPEEISKAVASLPAEQMFELMKQMKMCIENNPQEARNLLLQNPQLAYALLQAQVIMRIVDPEVAMKILNRPITLAAGQEAKTGDSSNAVESVFPEGLMPAHLLGASDPNQVISGMGDKDFRNLNLDSDFRVMMPVDKDLRQSTGDSDLRMLTDPRFRAAANSRVMAQDPRTLPPQDPRSMLLADTRLSQLQDPRIMPVSDPRTASVVDPRVSSDPRTVDPRMMPGQDPRIMPGHDPRVLLAQDPRAASDPRLMQLLNRSALLAENPRPTAVDPRVAARPEDPRKNPSIGIPPGLIPQSDPRLSAMQVPGFPAVRPPFPIPPGNLLGVTEDQEKAALIMQVLQLSDEQIAALPPEQRQGILVLKEQIARSQLSM